MERLNDIRLILFDLDGTLIDTVELIYSSFKYATETVLGRNYTRDELLQNLGRPLLDQMVAFSPSRAEELVEAYHRHNIAHHDEMIRPYPGVSRTLATLKNKGFLIGVVTSKRRDLAERGLSVCGLDKYIDKLVAMEDTARHKPDPMPVNIIMKQFGISSADALFVGDSPFDLTAGRQAGAHTVAALWGPFKRETLSRENPETEIEKIEELLDLL